MTTIIWRKYKDWKLVIASDKRSTLTLTNSEMEVSKYSDDKTKIYKFVNEKNSYYDFLLWISWDALASSLVKELYEAWIQSEEWKNWIDSIVAAIQFTNCIKENCNIKDPEIHFLIMNKKFQIDISCQWQVSEMLWDNISIWSWSYYFKSILASEELAKAKFNINNFELEDYFEIISTLDPYTSSTFEILTLD